MIYNYCSKCGRKIKIDVRDPILSLSLERTKKAVCNECDPESRWEPVYPKIEGEGFIGDWKYKVFETKAGKGLLLMPPRGKNIYLAPLASKSEIMSILNILPDYVREALSEFELIKKMKKEMLDIEKTCE